MKDKIIHLKKFMGGLLTPKEAHRKYAFGGRGCTECGQPAVVRIRTFGEVSEVNERSPQFLMQLAKANEGHVPIVDFTYGKFVRMGEAFACRDCASKLEQEAARAPSWCLVEIDRGPKDEVAVQVPNEQGA